MRVYNSDNNNIADIEMQSPNQGSLIAIGSTGAHAG